MRSNTDARSARACPASPVASARVARVSCARSKPRTESPTAAPTASPAAAPGSMAEVALASARRFTSARTHARRIDAKWHEVLGSPASEEELGGNRAAAASRHALASVARPATTFTCARAKRARERLRGSAALRATLRADVAYRRASTQQPRAVQSSARRIRASHAAASASPSWPAPDQKSR